MDAASDWLLIKHHRIDRKGFTGVQLQNKSDYISYRQRDFSIYRKEDVLFQLKIRVVSEKFKTQPGPSLRPRSVNCPQHFRNLSRKTVSLTHFLTQSFYSTFLLFKRRKNKHISILKKEGCGVERVSCKKSFLPRRWHNT